MRLRNTIIMAALCAASGARANVYMCRPCTAGTYAGPGATACTPCWAGTAATGAGNTSCTPCNANDKSYSDTAGATSCSTCPPGQKANSAHTTCYAITCAADEVLLSDYTCRNIRNLKKSDFTIVFNERTTNGCDRGVVEPGIYRVVLSGSNAKYTMSPGQLTYNFALKETMQYVMCAAGGPSYTENQSVGGNGAAGSYLKLTSNISNQDYYFVAGGGGGKGSVSYGAGGGGGIGGGGAGAVDDYGAGNSYYMIYQSGKWVQKDYRGGNRGDAGYHGEGGEGLNDGKDAALVYLPAMLVLTCGGGGAGGGGAGNCSSIVSGKPGFNPGGSSPITISVIEQLGNYVMRSNAVFGGDALQDGKASHVSNVSDPDSCLGTVEGKGNSAPKSCAKLYKSSLELQL